MTGLTMGSLFDGSGGFPLGALMCGIQPVWASEIEPFPIRVTTKRLPFMKHYGDINKVNGATIEPVDIITFGSPCTNLSLAGKREGLNEGQSSLFHQAIRVIREMRKATNDQYPRFIVWENVPGAYSSAGGRDFHQVLTEIVRTKEETATVPMPAKNKWLPAGEIVADDFSLAWRTLDAQFWGVAQRRRRCYLVADFAGECAGKILFEFDGLSGYSAPGGGSGQETAADTVHGAGEAGGEECLDLFLFENHGQDARYKGPLPVAQTLSASCGNGGNNQPFVVKREDGVLVFNYRSKNLESDIDTAYALASTDYKGTQCVIDPMVPQTLKIRSGCAGGGKGPLVQVNKSATLSCNNDQTLFQPVAYSIGAAYSYGMLSDNPESGIYQADTSRTLDKNGGNPACNQGGIAVVDEHAALAYDCRNHNASEISATLQAKNNGGQSLNYINPVLEAWPHYIVRRLTPKECALLQGFPINWCDELGDPSPSEEEIALWHRVFEEHRLIVGTSSKQKSRRQIVKWLNDPSSDSAEYRMWGNGVALPCVRFVMAGIVWLTLQ